MPSIAAILFVTASADAATTAPAVPEAPAIVINPDVYYPFDEILYLEGRASPKIAVEILLQKQGAKPRRFTVKSDARGEWSFAEKVPLEAGEWEVRTRAVADQDRISEWSNPRVFKVIASGVTIGGFNIKFAALSFTIIVLLVLGGAAAAYFVWRVRRLKAELQRRRARETHESVREGFREVRRDLMDELAALQSSGRTLTPDELKRKEHVLRELERIEKMMEREISEIDPV